MSDMFEQFWQHYPRRNGRPLVGKQACLALFSLLTEDEQAHCVQAAKQYKKASLPRADESFVPAPRDPIRFLKADWWRDWVEGPASVCDFRCTPACEQPVEEGQTACAFHVAYRLRIQRRPG